MRVAKRPRLTVESEVENAVVWPYSVSPSLVQPTLVRMCLSIDVVKALLLDVKEEMLATKRTVAKLSTQIDSLCFSVDEVLELRDKRKRGS